MFNTDASFASMAKGREQTSLVKFNSSSFEITARVVMTGFLPAFLSILPMRSMSSKPRERLFEQTTSPTYTVSTGISAASS